MQKDTTPAALRKTGNRPQSTRYSRGINGGNSRQMSASSRRSGKDSARMSKQSSRRQLNPYYADADSRMQEMMDAAKTQVYDKPQQAQQLAIEPEPEEQESAVSEVQRLEGSATPDQMELYFD